MVPPELQAGAGIMTEPEELLLDDELEGFETPPLDELEDELDKEPIIPPPDELLEELLEELEELLPPDELLLDELLEPEVWARLFVLIFPDELLEELTI